MTLNASKADVHGSPADSERLNRDILEGNRSKWERVWQDSGIKFASQGMEAFVGVDFGPRAIPDVVPLGTTELAAGDLVALRDAVEPSDANQHLHRVVEVIPAGERNFLASLGPALPRSEWPEPMRAATIPTSLHVESMMDKSDYTLSVVDGGGQAICRLSSRSEFSSLREGYLGGVIAKAARLGFDDATEGNRRFFRLIRGNGSWQVEDSLGNVADVERRSLFQRRPPEFVRAVLTATRAAYADGVNEATDVKQRAEHDPEAEVAPRI